MTRELHQQRLMQAYDQAQKIAFSPFIFQACATAKELGLLNLLGQSQCKLIVSDIAQKLSITEYGVSVLANILLQANVIEGSFESGFSLSKTGECLLYDTMTAINFDFADKVNYKPLTHTTEAIRQRQPAGLEEFNSKWQTIYPHLKDLPLQARNTWFAFDHFYSDSAFRAALGHLKNINVSRFLDIGGNTGRFTKLALQTWPQSQGCIVDLPEQLSLMRENADLADYQDRIEGFSIDWLDEHASLAQCEPADVIWMSQFLDCFSMDQATQILCKATQALKKGGVVAILEPLCDCQSNRTAALSLACSSLYFTVVANGNSRFFFKNELEEIISRAGLTIQKRFDNVGFSHSLYLCA